MHMMKEVATADNDVTIKLETMNNLGNTRHVLLRPELILLTMFWAQTIQTLSTSLAMGTNITSAR